MYLPIIPKPVSVNFDNFASTKTFRPEDLGIISN